MSLLIVGGFCFTCMIDHSIFYALKIGAIQVLLPSFFPTLVSVHILDFYSQLGTDFTIEMVAQSAS